MIRRTPNNVEAIAAISTITSQSEYLTSTGGALNVIVVSGGGGGGGGAVTIADGADTVEGSLADAAVTAGSAGTVSGKLRTISADISTIKANQTNATQKTQLVDSGGTNLGSLANPLYTAPSATANSAVSTNNSSTTPLAVSGVFTGTSDDVTAYSEIRVSVFANVASATNGLSVQQSSDNTNWDIVDTYTIAAGVSATYVVPRQERYCRVVYTNGGTIQATFRLQTILNRQGTAPSSQRPADAQSNEVDLVQGQSFLMGYNGTTWDRLRSTSTGYLNITGSIASAATDNDNQVLKVGTKFNTTQPTLTNGQRGEFQIDARGNQRTTLMVAGTNVALSRAQASAYTTADAGIPDWGVRNDGAATSLNGTNGAYAAKAVDAQGRMYVTQKSTTSGPSAVTVTTASTVLFASNTARLGASIFNTSTTLTVYMSVGGTPTTSLHTAAIPPQGYFELTAGATNAVNGISASGSPICNVTEYA